MGSEYELKYRASEDCLTSVRTTFPARWQKIAMETTYYDTPSRSLSAKRYMLRSRLENGVSVCTLKTSGKGNLRGEWEVNCDSVTDAIPELCKLGCPADLEALCAEGLVPICGAEFTRQAGMFTLTDCTVELALDQGILFAGQKKLPLCEIEVELKSGSREASDDFARRLAEIYDLKPEEKSKFARALALCNED